MIQSKFKRKAAKAATIAAISGAVAFTIHKCAPEEKPPVFEESEDLELLNVLDSYRTQVYFDSVEAWYSRCDSLFRAITYVESRDNVKAHNASSDARGCAQITAIKVKACNGYYREKFGVDFDEFTHDDAWDYDRSQYMFELDMEFNNPELTIGGAANSWNPNHSKAYLRAIEKKYKHL